jgi:hypothetical protein
MPVMFKALTQLFVTVLVMLFACGWASAGDLEPPSGPAPTMKTLQEIWDKLEEIDTKLVSSGCKCNGTLHGNRWCDNGDGTITDLLGYEGKAQCLIWLKDAGWGGTKPWRVDELGNYDDAHYRAGTLRDGIGGLSDSSVEGDWRLPTHNELIALVSGTEPVSYSNPRSFINIPQVGGEFSIFWSSTSAAGFGGVYAWTRCLTREQTALGTKSLISEYYHPPVYVWPVRTSN